MFDCRSQMSAFHQGQLLTEGLLLVREDVCDWLNTLLPDVTPPVSGPELLTRLHSGVLLCELAGRVDWYLRSPPPGTAPATAIAGRPTPAVWPVPPRADRKATPGSFRAKDNIALFLDWCRGLGMPNTILFETRGLVASDEEKNVVLALLHLGELCAEWRPDMPVPQFARFKLEMAQSALKGVPHSRSTSQLDEAASDRCSSESGSVSAHSDSITASQPMGHRDSTDAVPPSRSTRPSLAAPRGNVSSSKPRLLVPPSGPAAKQSPNKPATKPTRFVKNVRTVKNGGPARTTQQNISRSKSRDDIVKLSESTAVRPLDEPGSPNIDLKIKEITNRCQCHTKFVVERTMLQEGMYKIGTKNIFVRVFRGNIMLRVGGGWETLTEYLAKVDPCCKPTFDSCHTFPRRQSLGLNPAASGVLTDRNFRKSSQSDLISVKRQATPASK